jgi:hypothetical protein
MQALSVFFGDGVLTGIWTIASTSIWQFSSNPRNKHVPRELDKKPINLRTGMLF